MTLGLVGAHAESIKFAPDLLPKESGNNIRKQIHGLIFLFTPNKGCYFCFTG
jgi:hypothetical protein